MPKFTFELRGYEKLAEKFKTLSGKSLDKLEIALKVGALKVQTDAQGIVPVDTGNLKLHITHIVTRTNENEVLAVVGAFARNEFGEVEYASYVEFGTSKMKAQPFLQPAFDQNVDNLKQQIGKIFDNIV